MSEPGTTEFALELVRAELGKAMPGWLAERIAASVEVLIEAKLADFAELAAERVSQMTIPAEKEAK